MTRTTSPWRRSRPRCSPGCHHRWRRLARRSRELAVPRRCRRTRRFKLPRAPHGRRRPSRARAGGRWEPPCGVLHPHHRGRRASRGDPIATMVQLFLDALRLLRGHLATTGGRASLQGPRGGRGLGDDGVRLLGHDGCAARAAGCAGVLRHTRRAREKKRRETPKFNFPTATSVTNIR